MSTERWPQMPPAQPGDNPNNKENNWHPVARWGAEQAKEQARGYALGKAAEIAAKTALGARFFAITRWFWIAEWGSLALSVGLVILGIITIVQGDTLLGIFGFALALVAFGLWFGVRQIRRFIERQIARAFAKFQSLVARGSVRPEDWPAWYQQNRRM